MLVASQITSWSGVTPHSSLTHALQPSPKPVELAMTEDGLGLTLRDIQYRVGDYVYLDPYTFTR